MHPCRTALIYSPLFGKFNYGDDHPFKPQRYRMAYELFDAYGLLDLPNMQIRDGQPVCDELVLSFHDQDYIYP
jgi:acetoin utilization protein AcuC